MKQVPNGQGARNQYTEGQDATDPKQVTREEAADAAGLSERQRKTALRVASVPEAEFDAQVKNTEAERKACDVRLRAERRVGELLRDLARAPTAGLLQGPLSNDVTTERPAPSPYANALARHQISRQSAHRYQQLAEVPAADFEQALADPVIKPKTRR